jgi:UDP-2,4-diacetamido-2,4,6-trideoxy-beta-L-altropyranose hydrolase
VILIRTDASTALGTGHAMRCLALTQALRDRGADVMLAAATLPPAIAERYRSEAAGIVALDVATGSGADVEATAALADRLQPESLVIDGYSFDDAYVDVLGARMPVLLVDDWPRAVPSPSLLLNQNAYASRDDYPGLAPEQLLLGPSYALLRREYAAVQPPHRGHGRAPEDAGASVRILVTLGGADPENVTGRVVAALAALSPAVAAEVRVLIGAAHPDADALARDVSDAGFQALHDVREMLAEEDWADVAIGAAGTTSLELAARGLPAIHAVLMDNQVRVAEEMERRGVAISAGAPDDGFEARLAAGIEALRDPGRRSAMSAAGRRLVDGQGAGRVAARLLDAART